MANVVEILINAKNNASKAFRQTATDAGKLQAGVASLKAAFASLAVGVAAREVWDFAMQARQAGNELENARNKLTQAAGGVDEYRATIQAAQAATRGMVSETKLANGAFVLLEMGLASNATEAAKLANAGNILSKAFESQGASVEMFNRILSTGSVVLLDNFGLSQRMVMERQKEIEATQGLSGQEARLAAIRELAIDKAERLASTMSDVTVAAGQNQAAYEDMEASLGQLILTADDATPVLTEFYKAVANSANGFTFAIDQTKQLNAALAETSGIDLSGVAEMGKQFAIASNPVANLIAMIPDLEGPLTSLAQSFIDNTEAGQAYAQGVREAYLATQEQAKAALNTVGPLSIEAEAALRAAQAYEVLAGASNRARQAEASRWQALADNASQGDMMQMTGVGSLEQQQVQEGIDAYKAALDEMPQQLSSSFNTVASDLSNQLSGAVNEAFSRMQETVPGLADMFAAEDPGEFGRRLGALADGLDPSDMGFIDKFKEQAGGNPIYAALLQSIQEGDSAGVAEEANRLLSENLANVIATGLKQNLDAKLREQNLLGEAQKILAEQMGEQPQGEAFNAAALAAGDASLAQEQVKTGLDNVGIAAQDMQTKATGAFDASIKGATDFETVLKRIKTLTGGINGDLSAINQQGVIAGNNFGVLPNSGVGHTQQ